MNDYERLKMMEFPEGIIDVVIDTDAATEVDDPFAIAYALCSGERLNVKAIFAAPFAMNEKTDNPKTGMEMSYAEICNVMNLINKTNQEIVFKGSENYLLDKSKPMKSDAANRLIELSKDYSKDKPLYVLAIGAITNIASALLLCPELIEKIVIVWLAGDDFYQSPNAYNVYQDVKSAQVIFDSGVPLIHVPCRNVTSHMLTSVPELESCIGGKNALCDYLIGLVKEYGDDHFAWGKQIWDIAVIGYMLDASYADVEIVHAPIITDQLTWSFDYKRHFIKNVRKIDRDKIFRDMFIKLGKEFI